MISNPFDDYERKARIYPAIIVLLPIFLSIYFWFPNLTISGLPFILIIYFSLALLVGRIIRNRGLKAQELLFNKLGGKPTTILLRWHDDKIDPITKRRYHNFISSKIPDINLPTPEFEKTNPKESDIFYDSAVKYLLEFTRNTKKFPFVYKENVFYGFSRNLWASKNIALTIAVVCIVICLYLHLFIQLNQFLPLVLHSFVVFCWVFLININFVKIAGFNYANSLLRACESLEKTLIEN